MSSPTDKVQADDDTTPAEPCPICGSPEPHPVVKGTARGRRVGKVTRWRKSDRLRVIEPER